MATALAMAHAQSRTNDSRDLKVTPAHQDQRKEKGGKNQPNYRAREKLAEEDTFDGDADGEPANDKRLRLGAYRIRKIDNSRDEESKKKSRFGFVFKGAHQFRRREGPQQAQEKPRQTMRKTPPNRLVTCRIGLGFPLQDAAHACHIFLVFP